MCYLPVKVKVLDQRLVDENVGWGLPSYGTDGSAGLDLRACIEEPLVLEPNSKSTLVSSGLSIYLEDPNYVGLIYPRSGLGHKQGIVLGNLTGVIDADYQGPLMISVWNRSQETVTINPGDRIAQYVVVPVQRIELQVVDSFDSESERGSGGFGHTGTN